MPAGEHGGARLAVGSLGALLVVLGVGGDAIGLGAPGFGRDQWLLVGAGLVALLAGLLGRRILELHRATALILLNTVLLLLAVELGAALWFRGGDLVSGAPPEDWRVHAWDGVSDDVAYYDEQPWSASMWIDYKRAWVGLRYHPFVLWRKAPFASETINVDDQGRRVTPGASCTDEAFRLFFFGGSTAWGFGSPDWGSIPAYLQQRIQAHVERPVCVVNLGEGGYVSTQELLALHGELQQGNGPDVAVFYDGWNDLLNVLYSDRADGHFHLDTIAAQLEGREPFDLLGSFRRGEIGNRHFVIKTPPDLELDWIRGSYTYALLQRTLLPGLDQRRGWERRGGEPDEVAGAAAAVYLANVEAIAALASAFDFDYQVFWQPLVSQGGKPLTPAERAIVAEEREDAHGLQVYGSAYGRIAAAAAERERLHYLGDVFDGTAEQLYIDAGHVLPRGNEIVADRIVQTLRRAGDLPSPLAESEPTLSRPSQ